MSGDCAQRDEPIANFLLVILPVEFEGMVVSRIFLDDMNWISLFTLSHPWPEQTVHS